MENNNYSFTYTSYETFGSKVANITPAKEYDFKRFIHDTSICTSTMILKRNVSKGVEFTSSEICEDYFFKCKILKICNAYCLNDYLTRYRIRKDSLQKNSFKNFYWIWKINSDLNKLNIFQNFFSLFFISLNSLKKYGLKNF